MNENEWLADRFEEHRTHLRAVAYRMLGSLTEADDAVQDTWLPVWNRLDLNRAGLREGAPKRYLLDMFPYPLSLIHI